MREYSKKPESQSRTLDSNPKAFRQAPIDVILRRYKPNIQRYASTEKEEPLQGEFESVLTSEQNFLQREENPNNTGLPRSEFMGKHAPQPVLVMYIRAFMISHKECFRFLWLQLFFL